MTGSQDRFQQAMNQGHSAAWDQLWDQAVVHYQHALEELPGHPNALSSLGLALLELQRYDEALACYRRAAAAAPNDPLPLEKSAQICERVGRLSDAITASMQAADLYLKNHEVERAIDNWVRVTRFNADHLVAHTRLAVTYERLGRLAEAVEEYLVVASIVQHGGDAEKAVQAIQYALQIMPDSSNAHKYLGLLSSGQNLPRPVRAHGGTGSLRMAQIRRLEHSTAAVDGKPTGVDPVAEARQKALITLADILFEQAEEGDQKRKTRRQPGSILRGTDGLNSEEAERAIILRHLGTTIDAQTQGKEAIAAVELSKAVEAGLNHPAAYFNLGLLNVHQEHPEVGLRDLQTSVKHADYALASRLLLGQTLKSLGRMPEAAVEYLEALKIGDAATVPTEQADEIRQLYEPLIEAQLQEKDENVLTSLCENVAAMLYRPDWQNYLSQVRLQLPTPPEGDPPALVAEILLQTRSNQVVESLATIRRLAVQNLTRSAMEEAFSALQYAPTYLPLHIQIGEMLLKEDRVSEAMEKFSIVATTYSARGEAGQACVLLNRLIQMAPMDVEIRKRLIAQLVASGQVNDAVKAYIEMAGIYYRQAELETARNTYMTALRLAQSSADNRRWSVDILTKMADIDLQRLDLRQALRVFEQVRTMQPGDAKVRSSIVDLNYRMSQDSAAMSEVEGYLSYLEGKGQKDQGLKFLQAVMAEHPEKAELKKRFAGSFTTRS
ncbi:MAG: tetratricopeptide repeat protein [Anaerolineaceae bacterium]|nr:tetratricopeptide repeat protein [Anaerolineaceae bacterium]